MKLNPSKLTIITLIVLSIFVNILGKKAETMKSHHKNAKHQKVNKQVNFVKDNSHFGSEIGVVVRKNPSVFVDNRMGLPLLEKPQEFTSFSNSNTSNLPNVGGYGKSPEQVNPTILFHSNFPGTIVKTQPAHIGYRNEQTTISALNKQTGRVETHNVNQKKPIYADIESVHTVHIDSVKPYDLQYRRFRKERNIVRDNSEFTYNRNERFINSR